MFIVAFHCYIHHEIGGIIVTFSFLVSQEMQIIYYLKFRAPHKGPDEICYLARSYPELL